MVPLEELLAQSRVGGALLLRGYLRSPWAVRFDPADHAVFYVVEKGACWLLSPTTTEPVRLVRGDLVLLSPGSEHILADEPDRAPVDASDILGDCDFGPEARMEYGGTGPETVLLAGAYRFEPDIDHPLLRRLPDVIHVDASAATASGGLQATIRLLSDETAQQPPGYQAIAARLVDALFVYVLRAWLDAQPEGAEAWLESLHDPRLGRVLSLMHRRLNHPWTVGQLAREASMSRAAFAREFVSRTGRPPLKYLTERRMEAAMHLLRTTNETLAAIAAQVGYESEYAFGKAFKRMVGASPGRYRTRARVA